ncbi:carboxypeptidase-like regulatory domain-containing protein [Pseudactinotalea sp.]|uniref:carboxypeptidase-like regulatory domain-containing protein n=1 Tax=Pseudactinotalea sp. TaxID=1926260 RepID=UPI003B3AE0CA
MTTSTPNPSVTRWSARAVGAAVLALGLAASAVPAHADEADATLTGVVVGIDGSTDTHAVVEVSPEGGGTVQRAEVAADGTFEIDAIEPGRYYVRSSDQRPGVDAVYSGAGWNGSTSEPNFHDSVEIGAGTTEVEFELPFLRGVLVTAVDEAGAPLPNIPLWIEFYDAENDRWNPLAHDAPITDEEGRLFMGLRSGSDTVRFCLRDVNYTPENNPELRYHTACHASGGDIEDATPVTLAPDDRKVEFSITMEAAGRSIWHEYPVVHGDAEVGGTLTVESNRWEPTGLSLAYQWGTYEDAGFVAITGATERTFVPTDDLDGVRLAVQVTGEAEGYVSTTATVDAGTVGERAPELASFELSGSNTSGSTVTAEIGATTPAEVNKEVTWYADGVRVPEVFGHSLTITEALAGAEISAYLRIYEYKPGGNSDYPASRFAFATLEVPVIDPGTVAIEGPLLPQPKNALAARVAGWDSEATLTYQWYRGDTPISGATRPFYAIQQADGGHRIYLEVTATMPGAEPVTVRSEGTRQVGLGGVIDPPRNT